MNRPGQFTLSTEELVGATAILSFGLSTLVLVLLLAIFGDRLPVVESEDEAADTDATPEQLRERYARGEIIEAEFERRIERLLETEDLERRVDEHNRSLELE